VDNSVGVRWINFTSCLSPAALVSKVVFKGQRK
jgi:hypothetical protein